MSDKSTLDQVLEDFAAGILPEVEPRQPPTKADRLKQRRKEAANRARYGLSRPK